MDSIFITQGIFYLYTGSGEKVDRSSVVIKWSVYVNNGMEIKVESIKKMDNAKTRITGQT